MSTQEADAERDCVSYVFDPSVLISVLYCSKGNDKPEKYIYNNMSRIVILMLRASSFFPSLWLLIPSLHPLRRAYSSLLSAHSLSSLASINCFFPFFFLWLLLIFVCPSFLPFALISTPPVMLFHFVLRPPHNHNTQHIPMIPFSTYLIHTV